jgi:uncharacterized protein (DUF433 family)
MEDWMATTNDQEAKFPRIAHDPRILFGEPCIQGTRIPVRIIVEYYALYGDIERVQRALPHLERADIDEALQYYSANRTEIDRYIAANKAEDDAAETIPH